MNPFYNPDIIKTATFPRWYWLWLWMFPTSAATGEGVTTFYKVVNGRIYIVEQEAK